MVDPVCPDCEEGWRKCTCDNGISIGSKSDPNKGYKRVTMGMLFVDRNNVNPHEINRWIWDLLENCKGTPKIIIEDNQGD